MINKQVKLMIATLLVGISLLMVYSTATANVVNSQTETEVDSGTTTERCSATTKKGTQCTRPEKSNGKCWQHQ